MGQVLKKSVHSSPSSTSPAAEDKSSDATTPKDSTNPTVEEGGAAKKNGDAKKAEEIPRAPKSKKEATREKFGDDMQRARIAQLFRKLDQNRDGKVDPDELEKGLEDMGYAHVNRKQIMEFLKKSDVSQTGDLDLAEFTDYLIQHERELHFHFETLDENKDGESEEDQLSHLGKCLPE